MNIELFRLYGHHLIDWIADYYEQIESYPVKSPVSPGDIKNQLPSSMPIKGESYDAIFSDFIDIILPGITHWQHPNFHGYFPANSSYPSILGAILTEALGLQCMTWEASPAAAELEERTLEWLRDSLGLPKIFSGVIQDSASVSTLCSLLCARERYSNHQFNNTGMTEKQKFSTYCSNQAHFSIEKAIKIAGIGLNNLRKIDVNDDFSMNIHLLETSIKADIAQGMTPLWLCATIGTTGCCAVDPLKEISEICKKYNIWLHVDAAYLGSILFLPPYRYIINGIEDTDSFVFNPHKWLFTNFDCSAFYIKDKDILLRTFQASSAYINATENNTNDYKDWGIQLGRRFRSLKLWFVLRNFGIQGIQEKITQHILFAKELEEKISSRNDFEMVSSRNFNIFCFRYHPKEVNDEYKLDSLNKTLLKRINSTGEIFLSSVVLKKKFCLRIITAQTLMNNANNHKIWVAILNSINEMPKIKSFLSEDIGN